MRHGLGDVSAAATKPIQSFRRSSKGHAPPVLKIPTYDHSYSINSFGPTCSGKPSVRSALIKFKEFNVSFELEAYEGRDDEREIACPSTIRNRSHQTGRGMGPVWHSPLGRDCSSPGRGRSSCAKASCRRCFWRCFRRSKGSRTSSGPTESNEGGHTRTQSVFRSYVEFP
jgi:hypothetical protein